MVEVIKDVGNLSIFPQTLGRRDDENDSEEYSITGKEKMHNLGSEIQHWGITFVHHIPVRL